MKVFINYKRHVDPDHALARFLEGALRQAGHEVFRDETGIEAGAKWAQRIQDAIENCEVTISLISNASLGSEWVLNEIDFARKRDKTLIPVVLEKLEESAEFQEFIPRFLRIQQAMYAGADDELGRQIIERLARGSSAAAARAEVSGFAFHEGDDSINPSWQKYLDENPDAMVGGKVRLRLRDAVRLAFLRSRYYQRNLAAAKRAADAAETAAQADPQVFEAYRRCFFTQVAIGEFGLSGFVRPGSSILSPHPGETGGYLGLLLKARRVETIERQLDALRRSLGYLQIRYEVGVISQVPIQEFKKFVVARQAEWARAQDALQDSVEEFCTYTLGLPVEVPVVVEDRLLETFALSDPSVDRYRDYLDAIRKDLSALGGAVPEAIWADTAAKLRGFRQEALGHLESLGQVVFRASAASIARRAAADAATAAEIDEALADVESVPQLLRKNLDAIPDLPAEHDDSARFQQLNSIQNWFDELAIVQLRARLLALDVPQADFSLDQAEQIAHARRPDAELLKTDAALRRSLRGVLRKTLADMRRLCRRFEISRAAAATALRRFYFGFVLRTIGKHGVTWEDANTQMNLALLDAYDAWDDLVACWVRCYADRMRLFREMGVMRTDQDGLWVDEPPAPS